MVRLTTALSWLSGGLTAAVFAGVAALPLTAPKPQPSFASLRLMPEAEDAGPRAIRIARATPPSRTTETARPGSAEPAATTASEPRAIAQAAAPAATAASPPATSPPATSQPANQPPASAEPDRGPPEAGGWTEAQVREALQACLELLAPIAADIDVVPAPKNGACGTPAALLVKSVGLPKVDFQPPVTLNCPMVAALHTWVSKSLQPAATDAFGQPATRLIGTSAYSCRTRYGLPGERLSEHAFANAIDIGGIGLAQGRTIDVLGHWGPTARDASAKAKAAAEVAQKANEAPASAVIRSDVPFGPPRPADLDRKAPRHQGAQLQRTRMALGTGNEPAAGGPESRPTAEGAFLRKLHAGACGTFSTVLGPEANEAHRNHFHFDLAERRRGPYCQ